MIEKIYYTCAYAIESETLRKLENYNKNRVIKFIFLDPNKYVELPKDTYILAMQKWAIPHLEKIGYASDIIIDFEVLNFSVSRLEKFIELKELDYSICTNISRKALIPFNLSGENVVSFVICTSEGKIKLELSNMKNKIIITDIPYNYPNIISIPNWQQISDYCLKSFKQFVETYFIKHIDVARYIIDISEKNLKDIRQYYYLDNTEIYVNKTEILTEKVKCCGNYKVYEEIVNNIEKDKVVIHHFFPFSSIVRSKQIFNRASKKLIENVNFTNDPHNVYTGKKLLNLYRLKNEILGREYSNIGETIENYTFISFNCIASFVRSYLNIELSGPSGYWGVGSEFETFGDLLIEDQYKLLKSLYTINPQYRMEKGLSVLECDNDISWIFNHHEQYDEIEIKNMYHNRLMKKKLVKPFYIIGVNHHSEEYYTLEKIKEILNVIPNVAIFCNYQIDDDRVFQYRGREKDIYNDMLHFGNCNFEDVLRFQKIVQRSSIEYPLNMLLTRMEYKKKINPFEHLIDEKRVKVLRKMGQIIKNYTLISHSCESGFANDFLYLEQSGPTSFLWSDYKKFYNQLITNQEKFIYTLYNSNAEIGYDQNINVSTLSFDKKIEFYFNHHKNLSGDDIRNLYYTNLKKEKIVKPFFLLGIDEGKIDISDEEIVHILSNIPNIIIFTNRKIDSERVFSFPIIESDGEYNSLFFFQNAPIEQIEKAINIIEKSTNEYTI